MKNWNNSLKSFFVIVVVLLVHSCGKNLNCSIYGRACWLHLDQNSINISKNMLENCPNDCTQLFLDSKSLIGRSIDNNAFQGFTQLSSLSVRLNLTTMQSFSWLSHLQNLQFLNLSFCNLTSLNTSRFSTVLPYLQNVDLSHNKLSYLYLPFLSVFPQLRHLNISYNDFKDFPDLPSNSLSVNIANNPLKCTCTNVHLNQLGIFLSSNFNCTLSACPYFLEFKKSSENLTLFVEVAGSFEIPCNVNASNPTKLGVFSPIGFIPSPSWNSVTNFTQTTQYEYFVFPIRRPVLITTRRITETYFVTAIDYTRGHHGGLWQCVAYSNGGFLLDSRSYMVIVGTGIQQLFLTTTIIGFITTSVALFLGLTIGGVRLLVDTRFFKQPQSHKFFVRPLIGVIPVPSMQTETETFVEAISLRQRICSECFVKPAFLCGYCLSIHAFAKFEVLRTDEDLPVQPPPPYKHSGPQCLVDASSLLITDCGLSLEHSVDYVDKGYTEAMGSGEGSGQLTNGRAPNPHENVLNYDFPSEFCHCYHLDMRSTNDGETTTSTALRDVKLIFHDENLAQEYTEVLQLLQVAAKSNDAATFCERLEDFRGRLVHDVGARVRVAREEIVALKERSARSVARLRDQSGVVAQIMKAGFSQVRDSMRSVAELCTGGSACDIGTTDALTIGQSISVVSIYKDEITKKPKERCVSNFNF